MSDVNMVEFYNNNNGGGVVVDDFRIGGYFGVELWDGIDFDIYEVVYMFY